MSLHAIESDASGAPGRATTDLWPRAGALLLGSLAVYFTLHIATRCLISNSLQLDEAEQLLVTQDWRWGYGSQPPLYNWLQHLCFSVLGTNVFALSLLKNTLLWSVYFLAYLAAREILSHSRLAVLAAGSLLFLPQLAWESQRDQTHLVLATACSTATLFIFVRLLKTGRASSYAAFGALVGCGLLSKYNYLFFALSLLAAALTLRPFRAALLTPKMLLALAAFAVIAGPHLYWLLGHQALATSQSNAFNMAPSSDAATWLAGVIRFFKKALTFLAVPCLVYSPWLYLAWRARSRNRAPAGSPPWLTLLLRTFGFGLSLALLLVLFFRVTYVRERWFQPTLVALPILLAGWAGPQLLRRSSKPLLWLMAASAVAVLVLINGTALGANLLHRANNLNVPHAAVAAELRRQGFQRGTILADGFFLGGNMKMQFQESRVITPGLPFDPPLPPGPKLIVWRASNGEGPSPHFLEFAATLCGIAPGEFQPQYLEVPANNGPHRTERVGFFLFEGKPSGAASIPVPTWRHLSSKTGDLPVPNGGTEQTACVTADFDGDGAADIVIAERTKAPAIIWLRHTKTGWDKYLIDDTHQTPEAGGVAFDVDSDGDLDLIIGGDWQCDELWWYENPAPHFDPQTPWKRHLINKGGGKARHDQAIADFKGTGKPQLMFWNQGSHQLLMAEIPPSPRAAEAWPVTEILNTSNVKTAIKQEGMAAFDVDGDGKVDLIAGIYWFKHEGGNRFRPIQIAARPGRIAAGHFKPGKVAQMVMAPGDSDGPLLFLECQGDPTDPRAWKSRDLLGQTVIHGHSLALADFNGDGHLDIFCGEMARWGNQPAPDNPKARSWILYGDGQGNFKATTFATGFEFHEARVADVNGDGKPDLVSKPYSWDTPRLDIWLNLGNLPEAIR